MWTCNGFEEFFTAEALHFLEGFLEGAPVFDSGFEPLILLKREGDTYRLAFDFAGPLVMRAAGARAAILDIAFANPANRTEGFGEFFILLAARGGRIWVGHRERG